MIIGFTGTRAGMNLSQRQQFVRLLKREQPTEFHHGDCLGADKMAHDDVRETLPNCKIVIHPCTLISWQAGCVGDVTLPVKPPLVRNHDIVDACDILVAAPDSDKEKLRSGTWATYRYAKGKKHTILMVP